MWAENKGWMGVCADFHFGPSAYVKMLSLSPSQVLPLQMPELSVRGGLRGGWVKGWWGRGGGGWGGERRARGRKSGKISILNKRNFVLQSPDYHSNPLAMLPNFLSPFWLFLFFSFMPPTLQLPAFIFIENSSRQCFRAELLCQSDELHLRRHLSLMCRMLNYYCSFLCMPF